MTLHKHDGFFLGFFGGEFWVVSEDIDGHGVRIGFHDAGDDEKEAPEEGENSDAEIGDDGASVVCALEAGEEIFGEARGLFVFVDFQHAGNAREGKGAGGEDDGAVDDDVDNVRDTAVFFSGLG